MSQIVHLLKPKEFRVWCRPNAVPGDFKVTSQAHKADCGNCLTAFRMATKGIKKRFRVKHTNRPEPPCELDDEQPQHNDD